MNTSTPHDRKLAEALRSLSIEPTPSPAEPRRPRARLAALAALVAAGALAGGATLAWYGVEDMRGLLAAPFAAASAAPPAAAESPAQAEAQALPTPSAAPPQARRIAGSGFVTAPGFAEVTAKYAGTIARLHVAVGDVVRAGQPLVALEDDGAAFALREARIALAAAELRLEDGRLDEARAQVAFERAEFLGARRAVPQAQIDDARMERDASRNAVAIAAHAVETASLAVERAQERVDALLVRAPIAGTVTTLDARVGEGVSDRADARDAPPLATVVDTTTLVIDADVAETNLARLRPGQTGEAVLDGYPDSPFAIRVARIAPVVSAQKGTVALRLELVSPPPGIRPNMAARIGIETRAASEPTNQQEPRS